MKSRALHLFIVLNLFLIVSAPFLKGADATYNNVTVTGTGVFGTWSGDSGPGLSLIYTDGTIATVSFVGSGSATAWQWWNYNGENSLSMALNPGNQLLLYSGSLPAITLNPSGLSTFAGSVTVMGTQTASVFAGSGASLTSLPAGQLSGSLPSSVAGVLHNSGSESASFGTLQSSGSSSLANGKLVVTSTSTQINTTNMVISGKLGIGTGTSSPGCAEDIYGVFRTLAGNDAWPGSNKGIELAYDPNPDFGLIQAYDRTGNTYKTLAVAGYELYFYSSQASLNMVLDENGYLGIGTTSPGYMLDVAGDINYTGTLYNNGVPMVSHVEPQGDLDMGDFTYDPNAGGGSGGDEMMSGGGFGIGGGTGSGTSGSGTSPGGH